jgi:uncharacterized PurR-regulated membrane protein YhhQ (DUF165 family)
MYTHRPYAYRVDVELDTSPFLVNAVADEVFERSIIVPNVDVLVVKYLYKIYIKIIITIPKIIAIGLILLL